MTFEEFESATPRQLRERARDCFNRGTSIRNGWAINGPLLSEAQFYLSEIDRKENTRIGRRDFWLEMAVIVLILAELVAALWGIAGTTREAREQAQILERVVSGLDRLEKTAAGRDSKPAVVVPSNAPAKGKGN